MFLFLSQFDDFSADQTVVVPLPGDCSHSLGDPRPQIKSLSATRAASSSLISGAATYPDEVFYPVR